LNGLDPEAAPAWSAHEATGIDAIPAEEAFACKLVFRGSLTGECYLQIPVRYAEKLSERCKGDVKNQDRLFDAVASAAASFARAQNGSYGDFTVECVHADDSPTDDFVHTSRVALHDDATVAVVYPSANNALATAVASILKRRAILREEGIDLASLFPHARNLNVVMDVELGVALRFGQRRLTLREVMELVSGSVVELDRQVDEPVELILDGKVIARGEAVVIDGNYGLRITEAVTPFASSYVSS
jgi:flagellar motor switch protein FliN